MVEAVSRIATLLSAEVVDRSQLRAESTAVEQALATRRDIFTQLVEEHGGRVHTTIGTNLVSAFPNAVEAVKCAVAIQQAVLSANELLALEERVLLRIGLNVGDIYEREGILYGDGVDIAIALAGLAIPGGVCLAQPVYEQIKRRLHVAVEFAGEKRIRCTPEPVPIYQVVEPGVERGYFSLWGELKRRNVFRAATAYAVVSWLLIQVASITLPTFSAPQWVLQAVISLAVIGFPVALVLAWVYEITPMGLKRSDEVLRQSSIRRLTGRRLDRLIIGLLVVVVAFLVLANYAPIQREDQLETEIETIAILAFDNRSADPGDEYFADGLADELLSLLARIPELKVASRTASFYFKGKDVDVTTIASTLMVGHVLTGSVQREGNRIRVTAALDDTTTGNLLWSERYDRGLEDILDIQSDIARSVAAAIVPVLSPQSRSRIEARPTESTQAYDYYLRGRDYLRQPAVEATLASATELFDRAIGLDARFAQAYAGLCEANLGSYEFSKRSAFFEQAEIACHRALTLDNSLWETRVALGNLYRTNGQYDQAVLELETAIAEQPNAVSPYLVLAQTYVAQGLLDRAEATFLRAEEIESSYWGVHNAFGNFLYFMNRDDEAIARYMRVTELAPDSGIGYDNLGNTYFALGRLDEAEAAFNASPELSRWTYTNRGLVYYYRGEYAKAVEDQKRAIELAPEYNATWGRLGDAYRFIPGEEANAHQAYETAIGLVERELAINPSDWHNVGRLAVYYSHTGRAAEAADQIETLLRLAPEGDAEAYYYASLVSLQTQDIETAYRHLEKVVAGGWSRSMLMSDPDLVLLHDDNRFAELLATAVVD